VARIRTRGYVSRRSAISGALGITGTVDLHLDRLNLIHVKRYAMLACGISLCQRFPAALDAGFARDKTCQVAFVVSDRRTGSNVEVAAPGVCVGGTRRRATRPWLAGAVAE
jgi:hypothetical protein